MGRKKELFTQKEIISSGKRVKKKEIIKESFNLNDEEIQDMLSDVKKQKKGLKKSRKEQRWYANHNQLSIFPELTRQAKIEKSIQEVSSSKISTYWGCPLAFYFNYIEKPLNVPPSPSLVFGGEVHYLIELFHKQDFKSLENFINTWNRRWWETVREGYRGQEIAFKNKKQPGQYCGLGINILKPFYEFNKKIKKPDLIEFDLSNDGVYFEGMKIMGFLDRVDFIGNRVIITDYKTNFLSPAQNTFLLHRNPQFTFYALHWYLKHGIIPELRLHHLRTGQVFKTKRTEEDFEHLEDVITKTKKRILEGDFTPFYGFHCKNCDFMEPACKKYCIGLSSKLKKLEEELKTEPEVDPMFSYEVPKKIWVPEHDEYYQKGDFKNAYFSLMKYLKDVKCPIEAREGLLGCSLWEEESPIQLPDPEV